MHGRAFPFLALAAALAGCEPAPPREALDAETLHTQAKQLEAVAAEADLLTQELAAGHLNRSYAWVHQQALGDEAGKAASELARPAPPALQASQRQALEIAGNLRLVVARIAGVQDDPAGLASVRRDLSGLKAQVRQVGGVAGS